MGIELMCFDYTSEQKPALCEPTHPQASCQTCQYRDEREGWLVCEHVNM